ncbi:hypothetical protein H9P43_006176 [Blastocladiella emersonii ATCC 22665]|nr:hypothetical protein H9P43_006176 [Blastocladiella emersonii ATCC 22665]
MAHGDDVLCLVQDGDWRSARAKYLTAALEAILSEPQSRNSILSLADSTKLGSGNIINSHGSLGRLTADDQPSISSAKPTSSTTADGHAITALILAPTWERAMEIEEQWEAVAGLHLIRGASSRSLVVAVSPCGNRLNGSTTALNVSASACDDLNCSVCAPGNKPTAADAADPVHCKESLAIRHRAQMLGTPIYVVVATPGRLLRMLQQQRDWEIGAVVQSANTLLGNARCGPFPIRMHALQLLVVESLNDIVADGGAQVLADVADWLPQDRRSMVLLSGTAPVSQQPAYVMGLCSLLLGPVCVTRLPALEDDELDAAVGGSTARAQVLLRRLRRRVHAISDRVSKRWSMAVTRVLEDRARAIRLHRLVGMIVFLALAGGADRWMRKHRGRTLIDWLRTTVIPRIVAAL